MPSKGLLATLSGALAFAAGLSLGVLFRWETSSQASELDLQLPVAAEKSENLAPLLTELLRAIEALTVAARGLAQERAGDLQDTSRRRPIEGAEPAPASPDLAAALNSLSEALRELPALSGTAPPVRTEDLVKPMFVDRAAAFAASGLRRAATGSPEAFDLAKVAFNQQHMFLTNQAVLTRYGTPDRISYENSHLVEVWEYVLPDGDEGQEEFYFRFQQGTVFETKYSD